LQKSIDILLLLMDINGDSFPLYSSHIYGLYLASRVYSVDEDVNSFQ